MGTGAGALAVGMAGCTGGDDDETDTPTGESTPTETATPEPVDEGEDVPRGGTLTVGLSQPPKGLNPLSTSSSYSWMILDHFMSYGTALDPVTYEVQPSAYADWTVENVESGEPDIYFNVREGLTFTDGEDFGIDDVLFSYNYIMDQEPGRYLSTVDPISEASEADNDWDVHLSMEKPIGTWDSSQLQLPLLPKHRWESVDSFEQKTPGEDGELVGLGWAADLSQFESDTSAAVNLRNDGEYPLTNLQWIEDHDNLRSGGPFLDTIQFRFYQSEATMNQDLLDGALDTYYGSVSVSQIDQVREDNRIGLVQGQDDGISYFAYNLRRTPFDDILFRQALNMLWDEIYWTQRLQRDLVHDGDFVLPPGYAAIRPETHADADLLTDPATDAYNFREDSPGVPSYEGIRSFLENGTPITGESGTFVGQDYPGALQDVSASVNEPLHDYSFGEVKSDVLKEEGVDKELYVNGQTIPEILGRPVTYLMYPPETSPELTQADENWSQNMIQLGIPVEREVQTFNSLIGRVYAQEDFDLYHMGWSNMSAFGTSTLYGLFHSDNADDHREEQTDTLLNNPMGYGVFDYAGDDERISSARTEMDSEKRNSMVAQSLEKIYLDSPYMVFGYDKVQWPANTTDFAGFLQGIAAPGSSNLSSHFYNVHQQE